MVNMCWSLGGVFKKFQHQTLSSAGTATPRSIMSHRWLQDKYGKLVCCQVLKQRYLEPIKYCPYENSLMLYQSAK